MTNGKLYSARLQFLVENPYLCDHFDANHTSFVKPNRNNSTLTTTTTTTTTTVEEPVALLASRGNCAFAHKAAMAQSIDPSVQFLIIHNYNRDGEDVLIPMESSSEFEETPDLYLLSVTHRAGHVLRQYALQEPEALKQLGGPWIAMDNIPPQGMLTAEDVQQMILSAIGLFFLMVSFSGCIMILIGTYGQLQANGNIILTIHPSVQNMNHRLTAAQVDQLRHVSAEEVEEGGGGHDSTTNRSCAICLDDSSTTTDWIVLPCEHQYHTECVVPWLTERQAKCPLCKYDVLQALLETENPSDSNNTAMSSRVAAWWTRLTRARGAGRHHHHRWTQVQQEHEERDGVIVISPEEMNLEMTETQTGGDNDTSRMDGLSTSQ